MRGIITVIGKDRVGIIAAVCNYLSSKNVNILDISQTILKDNFNMMMIVDATNSVAKFEDIDDGLKKVGEQIGVIAKLQHEDIFNSMHRI